MQIQPMTVVLFRAVTEQKVSEGTFRLLQNNHDKTWMYVSVQIINGEIFMYNATEVPNSTEAFGRILCELFYDEHPVPFLPQQDLAKFSKMVKRCIPRSGIIADLSVVNQAIPFPPELIEMLTQ